MAQTIQSVIDNLLKNYKPTDLVDFYIWTKDDIKERFPDGQEITDAEVEDVLSRFSFGDYVWDGISENWAEAINEVFGEFRCDECGDYDKEAQKIDRESLCRACGEEEEVV